MRPETYLPLGCHRFRGRCPAAPSALAAALDSEDLLAEVLLRVPQRPSFLPRAALVCKHWRRLVTDALFVRRFRAHHRTPPLLGFFLQDGSFVPALEAPDRVPPARFSLDRRDCESRRWGWQLRSCLHGLLLFDNTEEFLVYEPMTSDRIRVPFPQEDKTCLRVPITAAVVAAGGDSQCRWFHLVALITDNAGTRMFASVYSSDSGVWADSVATCIIPSFIHLPSTTIGDTTYWLIDRGILKFDLEMQKLLVIDHPPDLNVGKTLKCKVVPAAKDGQFGLAVLAEPSIRFWEREADIRGSMKWVLCKTVQLDSVLPPGSDEPRRLPRMLGFAEGNNKIFIGTRLGIFMIHLESMQFRKVFDGTNIGYIFPYSSF